MIITEECVLVCFGLTFCLLGDDSTRIKGLRIEESTILYFVVNRVIAGQIKYLRFRG